MPRGTLQLVVLLLAVPLQFLICKWTATSASERDYLVGHLSRTVAMFSAKLLKLSTWKEWLGQLFEDDDRGECPALEVFNYQDREGLFGSSPDVRSPRPKTIKYRVGQVIRHKLWNYRGVIVGWDEKLKAPDFWRKSNHPKDKEHWKDEPNYAILVDERDRPGSQTTYVPEENIEIISNTKILHQHTEEYFEGFDGAQYLPRPWLRKVYPHD